MKQCPVCQSTFEDRVDFCFQDGSPLEATEASADPTALPDPGTMSSSSLADAPTQVRKKPRGRGMFARPSVADMLTVSGSHVPPVGGNRVQTDSEQTTLGTPTLVDVDEAEVTAAPVEKVTAALEESFVDAGVDPADLDTVPDFTELPEPAHVPEADLPEISMKASTLEVPVSPAAVEVPEADVSQEDSELGPPGLEPDAPAVSLDDTWFGEGSELDDAPEDAAGLPDVDPIEDPGFADVGDSAEVGFDDTSWSASGNSPTRDAKIPTGVILGGIGVLAAAVGLTVMFSSEEVSIPPAADPVVEAAPEVQAPPPPPPLPEPDPEEPTDEALDDPELEGDLEDSDMDEGEDEIVAAAVGSSVETAPPAAPARVVVPVVTPPPAPARTTPPPPPAPARTTPPPNNQNDLGTPPSVWTGSPAAVEEPEAEPAPAPASNPWGTPTETVSRGRLTITTDPSLAVVYVDDRRIGRSPTSTEVTYGTHNVRVEKLDYLPKSRVVSVQASEVSVPFRLSPSAMVGQCNLLGVPGSAVAMNGRRIGSLPLTVECAPGVHRFDIQPAAGGEPFTLSKSVTFVHAGETENIFLTP